MTSFEWLGLNALFAMGASLIYVLIQVWRDPSRGGYRGAEWEMLGAWAMMTTALFFWPLVLPIWLLGCGFRAFGNYARKRQHPDA